MTPMADGQGQKSGACSWDTGDVGPRRERPSNATGAVVVPFPSQRVRGSEEADVACRDFFARSPARALLSISKAGSGVSERGKCSLHYETPLTAAFVMSSRGGRLGWKGAVVERRCPLQCVDEELSGRQAPCVLADVHGDGRLLAAWADDVGG